MRWTILVVWVVGLMLAGSGLAQAPARAMKPEPDEARQPKVQPTEERWYIVKFDGQRAGWMRAWEERTGEGDAARIATKSRMEFDLARGVAKVSLKLESEFVETARGEAVSMSSIQDMGLKPVFTTYTFTKDGIESRVKGIDRATKHAKPEGVWLTPAAAARYVEQRMEAGAKEIVVRSMDPSNGPVAFTATRRVLAEETIEVFGKSVPALRCETSLDSPPIKSIEYLDAKGEMLRTTMDIGGMKFELLSAEEAVAKVPGEAPEIMVKTFVKPKPTIKSPRTAERATYRLSLAKGQEFGDVPDIGAQDAERIDRSSWRVRVDAKAMDAATPEEAKDLRLTSATAVCDAADAKVVDLAAKSRDSGPGKDNSPEARARRLQRVVFDHIKTKSLGVGFASASEVVRTREGDCSEHAVLLAAALRADGIPSRVVSGLVYVEEMLGERDVFGYHMWTEALVPASKEGEFVWLTLDATMGPMRPDATHIALATSTLEDGTALNSLVSLLPTFGALQIDVESIE